jgi:hypothetical protein
MICGGTARAASIALVTLKRFRVTPIPVIRAAIFRVLEDAGIVFQKNGKYIGVSISLRKLPKWKGAHGTIYTRSDTGRLF